MERLLCLQRYCRWGCRRWFSWPIVWNLRVRNCCSGRVHDMDPDRATSFVVVDGDRWRMRSPRAVSRDPRQMLLLGEARTAVQQTTFSHAKDARMKKQIEGSGRSRERSSSRRAGG